MTTPAWYEKKKDKRPLGRSREHSCELILEYVRFYRNCSRSEIARHLGFDRTTPHLIRILDQLVSEQRLLVWADTKYYPFVMRYALP